MVFVGAEAIGKFDEYVFEFDDWLGVADTERLKARDVFVEINIEETEVAHSEIFSRTEVFFLVGEVEGFVELVDLGFELSVVGRVERDACGFAVTAAFYNEITGGFDGFGEREVAERAGGSFEIFA